MKDGIGESVLVRQPPSGSLKTPGRSISGTIFFYIVRETVFAFIVCFLFFFFVFFVNQILLMAGQILAKRVPPLQVALLLYYQLPSVVALAAPFASLSGTLMTIGRLSTDNEILVLLSSGVSYRDILFPALFVGLLISVMSFCANDILLPAGNIEFNKLFRRILFSSPGLEFGTNSVKRFQDTVIITGDVSGSVLKNIIIMDRTNEGERRLIISDEARLMDSGGKVNIELKDAFIQTGKENVQEDYDYASSSFLSYRVAQEDAVQAVYTPGPREMSSRDVYSAIKQKELNNTGKLEREKRRLARNALAMENVLREGMEGNEWNRHELLAGDFLSALESALLVKNDRNLSMYTLEFYKKFSIPMGALSFVFLAVTLGLMAKKSGQTVGFVIGVIISVIYWALLLGGQTLGTQMHFSPFWSMWMPNLISLTAGFILIIIRTRR